jgi:ubiquinone/menaquinone biosynthesis C-methylase UbiE
LKSEDASARESVSFNSIAPHYDRLERWFSRGLMHRARVAHLPMIAQCDHALLLGEGPGRFLPLLIQQFPNAQITCIDSSHRMLGLVRSNISEADRTRVIFLESDIRSWRPPANQFDLLVTNFFLDCFTAGELELIIPSIAGAATSDSQWLIADFNIPKGGLARWRAKVIVGCLYRFFHLTTGLSAQRLISPQPWLERTGFCLHRRMEFDHGLLRSDWWIRPRPASE